MITFPHALQWCLLFVNVNFASHCMQFGASESGTHLGATRPSSVIAMFMFELIVGVGVIAPGGASNV